VPSVYDYRKNIFEPQNDLPLPLNPVDGKPLILVPKRWLRFVPWLNYEEYFEKYCPQDEISHRPEELTRVAVLNFNREHYGAIDNYIKAKERTSADCHNDPLFSRIPVISARRKLEKILKLPPGKVGNADKQYEEAIGNLLPSLLYPELDFAQVQARTESGVSIRDLIFYNTRRVEFLKELLVDYGSRQITFELKNVGQVEREHIDQINRYLADELGRLACTRFRRH
jgi:hypothetical protein